MRNKILMTLALLITAVTGTWAQNVGIAEMTSDLKNTWTNDEAVLTATDLPGFVKVESDVAKAFSGELPQTGFTMIIYAFSEEGKTRYVSYQNGVFVEDHAEEYTHGILKGFTFPIYYISESGIEVKPVEGKTNEWTFEMPAFDVEIAPIYAPTAQWAKDKEVDQLPTAIEGIIAGTEDAIVKAGTVVEGQGTVMYFATTDAEMTAEKAAAAEGWLSTLPTAAGYDDVTTVYVWYYIKGADTPQGETAIAENTFNDSEICTTPIEVTLLSNKFDIQFNAANANTIEAGKATVKVGETAAEVKEGKLTGVKMDSKVTITAKDGYKFRKAEAKKKSAAAPTTTVTWNSSNVFNSAHENVKLSKWYPTPLSYEGITISFSGTKASSFQAYNEDDHIGSLTCYGNYDDSFTFTAPSGKKFCKIEIINNGSIVFTNYGDWTSDASNKIVWSGTAATAVTLGSVYTDADDLNSIVFYLSE